ncbi:ATP-binding protein [Sulfuricurvum sp. IAE1]|uniref:AVAST type 2 anti-phage system protein Avs2 n=1 Tax=Sulfuricurvum sp. IAE1 TaxID=2546102 RepID=UPI00104D75EE|nr:AVAST type 2 anti-phage system protein Avs2 [Sulfuricurvum sp. IAE1]TDA64110.1 ATP-binding protein [Sulfuricurvum sp. IAE1]
MSFNWHAIKALNGSQNTGFEEFCCQLARSESPDNAQFVRKGTPDAGVECYCILEDGKEWGWQAKYFENFGDSQWSQLDESVENALDKHPLLVRYFICVPLDRPDARTGRGKSAKEKWDERVLKWTQWAADKGMSVEFVYWGSSELLERLMDPQHAGKRKFWFESIGLDQEWFEYRLATAISTAGPRYTPEIHVDLPIAQEFQVFGRTIETFRRIKVLLKELKDKKRSFEYSLRKIDKGTLPAPTEGFLERIHNVEMKLREVVYQPVGILPFGQIARQIAEALEYSYVIEDAFDKCDKEQQALEPEKDYRYSKTKCGDILSSLRSLEHELRKVKTILEDVDKVASTSLLILQGNAGTGKTHLLCDLAKQRIENNQPTVLLMGHQFTTLDFPWNQARYHLDLPPMTLEEFVGALESAAEAADCRALILIDAINEGSGRELWPAHLAAFLSVVERSPWIGMVLSVRSSYTDIISKEILESAFSLMHYGFEDNEYDAVKTFFMHYGLELPSAPLLSPEFRNPLFLKTLCSGLQASGECRLPRGLHGITAIFDLYLSAVNKKLAELKELDYRESKRLVQAAVQSLAQKMVELDSRWIDIDIAEETINALLPERSYERSLYRKLIVSGIIGEEMVWHSADEKKEVVYFGYERLADHLIAKYLLDTHLDTTDPGLSFKKGGGLHFLLNEKHRNEAGLVEALCIQVPERTGCELISLAPRFIKYWGIQGAYFNSVIWRSPKAFNDESRELFGKLIRNAYQEREALDALLVVAIIPNHPFNALLLHNRLQKDSMPDRDSWWSLYLHKSWSYKGSAYRVVDWALSLADNSTVEDDVIELASITLSWFLSSSNRYLRDRATKALVNLLTGRLNKAKALVDRFAEVNDPYIAERVYAVAYGVAMRSNNGEELKDLAQSVYAHVFADGNPPAHILLRDYARGVIERALCLKADIEVNAELIRPPYSSIWPNIPSEEEIQPFLPDWSRGSHDSRESEWSRNRIGSSVISDDFARYVIGTNSWSTDFLSLKLDEPVWRSPDEQLEQLIKEFAPKEVEAWKKFKPMDEALKSIEVQKMFLRVTQEQLDDEIGEESKDDELDQAQSKRDEAYEELKESLTEEHQVSLEKIIELKNSGSQRAPKFDLKLIQRYVLWRVFDLGWTTERFGEFDRFEIGYHGRDAAKAERIGKKYQWIAYHEIMAYFADHFQIRQEHHGVDKDHKYVGPWQIGLRDIDPSVTLQSTVGGTSWKGHDTAWWCSESFDRWNKEMAPEDWIKDSKELPNIKQILCVTDSNKISWFNVHGYFNWQMPTSIDDEPEESERREIWYITNAYLIHNQDVDKFLKWAKSVNFMGRWMPEAQEYYEQFFGEHKWSPAAQYHQGPYFNYLGWTYPGKGCPVLLHVVSSKYTGENSSFDCSIDDGFSLYCPSEEIIEKLKLTWNGEDAEFLDHQGMLATFDPTVRSKGPDSLLVRKDLIETLNEREGITLCWSIIGEKRAFDTEISSRLRFNHTNYIHGAYVFKDGNIEGFTQTSVELIDDKEIE